MPEIFEPYRPLPEWLDEAILKYKSKLDFTVLEPKLREIRPKMIFKALPIQVELQDLKMKIVRLLSDKGILSDWNLVYCSYGLELLRIKKRFHPSVWAWISDYKRELKIVAQKWVFRGLDKEIMLDIAKLLGMPEISEFL